MIVGLLLVISAIAAAIIVLMRRLLHVLLAASTVTAKLLLLLLSIASIVSLVLVLVISSSVEVSVTLVVLVVLLLLLLVLLSIILVFVGELGRVVWTLLVGVFYLPKRLMILLGVLRELAGGRKVGSSAEELVLIAQMGLQDLLEFSVAIFVANDFQIFIIVLFIYL